MYSSIKSVILDYKTGEIPHLLSYGLTREISLALFFTTLLATGNAFMAIGMVFVAHLVSSIFEKFSSDNGGKFNFAGADAYVYAALLSIGTFFAYSFWGLMGGDKHDNVFLAVLSFSGVLGFVALYDKFYRIVMQSSTIYNQEWLRGKGNASQIVVFGEMSPEGYQDGKKTLFLNEGNYRALKDSIPEYERVIFKEGNYPDIYPGLVGSRVVTSSGEVLFPGDVDKNVFLPIPYLPFLVPLFYVLCGMVIYITK